MLASNLYSQETSDHKNRQNFSGTATINAKSTHPCPIKMLRELRLPLPQGIVHVGANSGRDEIPTYQKLNLKNCAYIEPIPTVFKELTKNLEGISNHYPIQALCADLTGEEVVFNVASNQGRSSSMVGFSDFYGIGNGMLFAAESSGMDKSWVSQIQFIFHNSQSGTVPSFIKLGNQSKTRITGFGNIRKLI